MHTFLPMCSMKSIVRDHFSMTSLIRTFLWKKIDNAVFCVETFQTIDISNFCMSTEHYEHQE